MTAQPAPAPAPPPPPDALALLLAEIERVLARLAELERRR